MKKRKNNKKLLLGLVVALAVILLAAIILLVVLTIGEEKSQNNDASRPITESRPTTGTKPADADTTGEGPGNSEGSDAPIDSTTQPPETTTQPSETTTQPAQDPVNSTQGTIPAPPPENTTAPTTPEGGDEVIQTPFCTLYYPGEYKDRLEVQKVQGQPYKVAFIARVSDSKAAMLFTISFGDVVQNPVGTILTESGAEVTVGVESYDFQPDSSWTAGESQIVYSMQEALNEVLAKLPLQEISQQPQDGADITVKTPYCDLHFPKKWKDYVTTEHQQEGHAYSVKFFGTVPGHAAQLLFVVHFNSDEGTQIASVGGVLVSLTVNELVPDASWSDGDRNTLFAMQEDLNYLLSKLNG